MHRSFGMMNRTALALASVLLLSPALASAQGVLFVVDVGSARLDVDALRARVAADAGRPLVRLGEADRAAALETLTVAFAGEGRWVLRHQHGTDETWVERTGVAPEHAAEVLSAAATELLRPDAADVYGTRAGHDLVDPFDGRWDPLHTAIDGEIVRPFIARGGMVYIGVTDPFARETLAVHLLDPWTR